MVGRRTWYPLSSSPIIAIIGTSTLRACIRKKNLEIRFCECNQARMLTVKDDDDGSKLNELSSAASSISIWMCRWSRAHTASVNVTGTYLGHVYLESLDLWMDTQVVMQVFTVRQYRG